MMYKKSKADDMWIKAMEFGHLMGCHQMPERSFFIRGYQFPVCARCTGVFLAFPFAVLFVAKRVKLVYGSVVMCGVMFCDWLIQFLKIKESTNVRRFVTGFIGGLGFHYLYIRAIQCASLAVRDLTKLLKEE